MNINRHSDELEQLLHAQEPTERAELAAFLSELRDSLPETPPADVADQHLAAITAAAAEAAHSAPAAASAPSDRPWSTRVRRLAGLTAVKVAIGATAAAAATGTGLAATGNLPDPVQQVVSDAADRIGIDLPAPAATLPATPPHEAPITVPPREIPGEDEREDRGDRVTPTPAQPDGGAPPTEVPGEGDPPADPSDRADERDASGRGDVGPPARRPDGAGPDASERATTAGQGNERTPAPADEPDEGATAEPEEDAEAPGTVTGDEAAPAREPVPALPLPEAPRTPERADR